MSSTCGLITLGRYSIHQVFTWCAEANGGKIDVIGDDGTVWRVKSGSLRYKLFAQSQECCVCHLVGDHFLLQHHHLGRKNSAHFNLYGGDPPVLFTKDHIIPRSKGGSDHLSNLQTMCEACNLAKANVENLSAADILKRKAIIEARRNPLGVKKVLTNRNGIKLLR